MNGLDGSTQCRFNGIVWAEPPMRKKQKLQSDHRLFLWQLLDKIPPVQHTDRIVDQINYEKPHKLAFAYITVVLIYLVRQYWSGTAVSVAAVNMNDMWN